MIQILQYLKDPTLLEIMVHSVQDLHHQPQLRNLVQRFVSTGRFLYLCMHALSVRLLADATSGFVPYAVLWMLTLG